MYHFVTLFLGYQAAVCLKRKQKTVNMFGDIKKDVCVFFRYATRTYRRLVGRFVKKKRTHTPTLKKSSDLTVFKVFKKNRAAR
jgi:hypothetical protein